MNVFIDVICLSCSKDSNGEENYSLLLLLVVVVVVLLVVILVGSLLVFWKTTNRFVFFCVTKKINPAKVDFM